MIAWQRGTSSERSKLRRQHERIEQRGVVVADIPDPSPHLIGAHQFGRVPEQMNQFLDPGRLLAEPDAPGFAGRMAVIRLRAAAKCFTPS